MKHPNEWHMCDVCHLSFKERNMVIDKAAAESAVRKTDERWRRHSDQLLTEFERLQADYVLMNTWRQEALDTADRYRKALVKISKFEQMLTAEYSGPTEEAQIAIDVLKATTEPVD